MITQLIEHLIWADRRTHDALATLAQPDTDLLALQAHNLGAQATWLARINATSASIPVWPVLDLDGCRRVGEEMHGALRALAARADDAELSRAVSYTNSRGATFTNSVDEILHHMVMHAMYHRGQVMQGVRQRGGEPLATDFIAFCRAP